MKQIGPWSLLPPAPDVCQVCAVKHAPAEPHNAQSMYYRFVFYADHGSWPTWGDAMAHCTPELQALWKEELLKTGRVKPEELELSK